LKVIICKNSLEMSEKAAKIFSDRIKANPEIVLGLATGETPIKLYKALVRFDEQGGLDFSRVTTFNLDEYLGLSGDNPQSYRYFMDMHLFNHINIDKKNTHILNGLTNDPIHECERFERMIREAGGIDLQLLGIGRNGHIGFNEIGSSINSRTRVVKPREETIKDNSRFFDSIDDVPKKALTMGIATILEVKEIVLIADKNIKSDAVIKAVEEPVTEDVPASFLQNASKCTFIIDGEAASKLKGLY